MSAIWTVLLTAALGVGAFAPSTVFAQEIEAPHVSVVPAEVTQMTISVTASGTLIAREVAEVYARVSGAEVIEILVETGDDIGAGDVLARLDPTALTAQKAQAEANLASAVAGVAQAQSQVASAEASATQAQQALDRTRTLADRGDTAQSVLDQAIANADSAEAAVNAAKAGRAAARAQVQQAQAAVNLAALNVTWTEIRAPVGGVILTRNARLGALSAGSGALFTIARDGEIEVEAEVIETELTQLSAGDRAMVIVAGTATLEGHVRLIAPTVDPVTRLGTIRIALDSDDRMPTGLFARATITAEQRDALTLPTSAIQSGDRSSFVLAVEDGTVVRVPVTLGMMIDGRQEVLNGLAPATMVIERAGSFFRDGDTVIAVQPGMADGNGQQ